jgi:hypothetical protein
MLKSIIIGLSCFVLGVVAAYYTMVKVEYLPAHHPIIHDRINPKIILCEVLHGEVITNVYYRDSDPGTRHDAIERASAHKDVFDSIDQEVDEILADEQKGLGFIHSFWHTKQELLKEKYSIDWRPPSDLNPLTSFH